MGGIGAIFGGSKEKTNSSTPTGFQSLPGFGKDAFEQVISRGIDLSNNPDLFSPAGLTGTQTSALSALSAGFDPTSAGEFQTGMNTFFNPFEDQVVQNAIGDIVNQGQGFQSDIANMASSAGGFGGTRQALLESELQRNMLEAIGDVSASTRSAGFESAADRVLSDISRGQQVAGKTFQLADLERQIQTQQQQAPLNALQFLSGLTTTLPTGGGTQSTGRVAADNMGNAEAVLGGISKAAGMF